MISQELCRCSKPFPMNGIWPVVSSDPPTALGCRKVGTGAGEAEPWEGRAGSDAQLFTLSLGTKGVTGLHTLPRMAPFFVLWPQMGNSVSWFKHWLIVLFEYNNHGLPQVSFYVVSFFFIFKKLSTMVPSSQTSCGLLKSQAGL